MQAAPRAGLRLLVNTWSSETGSLEIGEEISSSVVVRVGADLKLWKSEFERTNRGYGQEDGAAVCGQVSVIGRVLADHLISFLCVDAGNRLERFTKLSLWNSSEATLGL